MNKVCLVCQNNFETLFPNKNYCSINCRYKAQKERVRNKYLLNKVEILRKVSESYRKHKHPCPVCDALISPRAKYCARHAGTGRSGADNHGWKGGKSKVGGYIRILRPNHPRANSAGYMAEHIAVWEQAHGKPLPDGWIVHHLNGVKTDNRVGNLVALPNRKHRHVLEAKSKRIQKLEALLLRRQELLL